MSILLSIVLALSALVVGLIIGAGFECASVVDGDAVLEVKFTVADRSAIAISGVVERAAAGGGVKAVRVRSDGDTAHVTVLAGANERNGCPLIMNLACVCCAHRTSGGS
jgi:hypothetical protein